MEHYVVCTITLKFIYSEKATKFCEISMNHFVLFTDSQIIGGDFGKFVAFLEYMNFIKACSRNVGK